MNLNWRPRPMTDAQIEGAALWHASRSVKHLSTQALKSEYLSAEGGSLLSAMRKMLASGKTPSLSAAAVMPECSQAAAKFALSLSTISTPDIGFEHCIELLVDKHTRTRIREACQKGFDDSFNKTKAVSTIVSEVASSALAITQTNSQSLVRMNNFSQVNRDIQFVNANPGKLLGLSTGFGVLDRLINGLTAQLYVIGGRPSAGKTAYEGDLVRSILEQGTGVMEFSLEMSADQKRKRYLSKLSGVSLSTYRSAAYSHSELQMLKRAQQTMDGWNHWVDDDPSITIDDIEVKTTMMIQKEGIGAITVDYLQLVNNPGFRDRFEGLGNISKRLKALSKQLNIPVIALAQLKRTDARFDPQLKRTIIPKPRLDDFRECGNIEQDLDVGILLHRDPVFSPQDAEVILAKQRNGPTHPGIEMTYFPGGVTFREKTEH